MNSDLSGCSKKNNLVEYLGDDSPKVNYIVAQLFVAGFVEDGIIVVFCLMDACGNLQAFCFCPFH